MGHGKLSGFSWHMEFHSSDKKEKAADCVYLSDNRECNNEKSYCYLSKCFDATHCTKRKTKGAEKQDLKSKKVEKKILFDAADYGDTVWLYLKNDKVIRKIVILKDNPPAVHSLCRGLKLGDIFKVDVYEYTIIKIEKTTT